MIRPILLLSVLALPAHAGSNVAQEAWWPKQGHCDSVGQIEDERSRQLTIEACKIAGLIKDDDHD